MLLVNCLNQKPPTDFADEANNLCSPKIHCKHDISDWTEVRMSDSEDKLDTINEQKIRIEKLNLEIEIKKVELETAKLRNKYWYLPNVSPEYYIAPICIIAALYILF